MALNPETGGGTGGGRRPGAGRPPGSLNKRTRQTRKMLEDMDCNPIRAMAEMAMDKANPLEIRAAMYRDLAGYFAPKLKSMDINANVQSELTVVRRVFSGEADQAALSQLDADQRRVIDQVVADEEENDENE